MIPTLVAILVSTTLALRPPPPIPANAPLAEPRAEPGEGGEGGGPPPRPIDRADQIMTLVESFQPADPYLRNKWSEVVRSAFLYAGAQKMFAATSQPIQNWAATARSHADAPAPDDFVRATLGHFPSAPPEIAAEARRFLAAMEENNLLIHLDELGAQQCRLVGPPPSWAFNSPLLSQETYEFGPLRNMAIGAAARIALAAESESSEKVAARFAGAMTLGRVACGRPMLMGLLTAHTIQNRVMLETMRLACAGKLDAAMCRDLLAEFRRRRLPGPRPFIEMERVIGLDAIDRSFQNVLQEKSGDEIESSLTELSGPEVAELYNAGMDRAREFVAARLFESSNAETPTLDDLATDAPLIQIPASRIDKSRMLTALAPPVQAALLSEREHRCIRAGFTAALLLELHRIAYQSYPAAIAEMTLPEGETWPADPLAPTLPLHYERIESSYLLYSVGADGNDDGGKPAPQRDRNALIGQQRWSGSDYIIAPTTQ